MREGAEIRAGRPLRREVAGVEGPGYQAVVGSGREAVEPGCGGLWLLLMSSPSPLAGGGDAVLHPRQPEKSDQPTKNMVSNPRWEGLQTLRPRGLVPKA